MHTHTHDSQHLRETKSHKRGNENFGLFGACHASRGFAATNQRILRLGLGHFGLRLLLGGLLRRLVDGG